MALSTYIIHYQFKMSHNHGRAIIVANGVVAACAMIHKKWTIGAMTTIAITSVEEQDKPAIIDDLYK